MYSVSEFRKRFENLIENVFFYFPDNKKEICIFVMLISLKTKTNY